MGNSDSKAKFRDSVYKLNNEDIPARNVEFWDKLWKIPTTAEEIFTLIQPDDVRMLRRNQPANLSTMFEQAVAQLSQIVDTPLPKYYSQALNCVRVLTRLIPFILEDTTDDFVDRLFWEIPEQGDEGVEPRSTAHRLIDAIMGLLFLPDFTVLPSVYKAYRQEVNTPIANPSKKVFPSILWAAGVGHPDASTAVSSTMDKHRKEILKLFLTCFSGVLYRTPDSYDRSGDKFLAVATSPRHCPLLPTLFHSLLNVVITYDPVGWGVPYAGAVLSDERENLVDISLQVLLVLLDFEDTQNGKDHFVENSNDCEEVKAQEGASSESDEKENKDHNNQTKNCGNGYRLLLSSISRSEDLEIIFRGISKLLNNYHQAMNTLLPNSIKQIKCQQELLVLLWKLLDENDHFLKYILLHGDVNQLVVPLLFLMYDGRKEPSKVGMIHICTFILLLLSGERDFGVALNRPFESRLPADLPIFTGNHADLLIVVIHKVIINGYEKLNSVYNCFLTIISNVSPYCKKLHMVASVRLLRLFKLFSQPRYLYDNEANHHLIFFLLDTFNNIIQYQYEGNQHLVYAIIQNKDLFEKLNSLPMPLVHTPNNRASQDRTSSTDSRNESTEDTKTPLATPTANEQNSTSSADPHTAKIKEETAQMPTQENEESRFVPTPKWVMSWKKKLPLNTTLRLLQHVLPELEANCQKAGGSLDENAVLQFLHSTTMVGLLPVPHPIVIRKYQPNQFTNLWFTTFSWGVIFLRNQELPLFDGKSITLFTINVM